MPRPTPYEDDQVVSDVKFATPPKRPTRYDWDAIAEQLKEAPMTWALIFKGDRVSVVNAIRQGTVAPVHADLGFEVRTTNNVRTTPRTCDLYLRFNPDKVDQLRAAIHAAVTDPRLAPEGDRDATSSDR